MEIGKYGIKAKLKETVRGHYAIPPFEGFKHVMCKKGVTQKDQAQTQDVNAVEFSGSQVSTVIPKGCENPQQHELHRRGSEGCSHGGLHQDSSDQRSSGGSGSHKCGGSDVRDPQQDLGRGTRSQRRRARRNRARCRGAAGKAHRKYQKAGQLVNFRAAYTTDKKYVSWIRKFIKRKTDPVTGKGSHPAMVQFRLCVALGISGRQQGSMPLMGWRRQ